MKNLSKVMVTAVVAAIPFCATAEHEQLPTLIVEGEALRPGTLGVAPDSTGLKDTASLLKRVPGANVNRNGPLTGIAQYRGMYGNRVNVKVDGFAWKEVGPNSMDPPLSHVPAPITDSLQVYRGISPVSTGIETIGGSMAVSSKKGGFTEGGIESHGVASVGYSSVDSGKYGSLFTSLANQNHRLHFGGSREYGNSYKFENDKSVRPTDYDRDSYNVGYGYQRQGQVFDVGYSNNNTGHTGTPALPLDILHVRGGVTSFDYAGDFDKFKANAGFRYQDMRHQMSNNVLRTAPVRPTPIGPRTIAREAFTEVDGFAASLGLGMPLLDGDISFGVDVDQSHHDAFIEDPNDSKFLIDAFKGTQRDRYSGFVEWRGKINDDLSLELGGRYTHVHSDTEDAVGRNPLFGELAAGGFGGPAASAMLLNSTFNNADHTVEDRNFDLVAELQYAVTDNLNIELGAARKTRSPSYQELFIWIPLETTGGLADGRNYIGNLSLNHEVAYQAELGLEWHSAGAYIAPRFFYHHVDDYIQGVELTAAPSPASLAGAANLISNLPPFGGTGPGTNNALQFQNIDARLYGVDMEMGYTINQNWRLDGTLSYVRGRRIDDGDNLYRIAPLNGRAQVTFDYSILSFSAEGEFYAAQNDVSQFNNEPNTPGYGLLNLRGEVEPIRGLVIGFGMENVFDKENADHLSGLNRAEGNEDLATGDRIPGTGRNYYATVSYDW